MAREIGFIVSAALVAFFSAGNASAHISLDQASTHKSRYGDAEQKDAPCGRTNGERGTNVYTYAPGETITIEVSEFIPHPSYFRIAFDQDGDDDFEEPASIQPIDPARPCPFNEADKCGEPDFYNNASVLPNMDNLEPHLASGVKKYTFEVKLPNVQCDNCTLQIIQVMQDTVHGAYNPVRGDPADLPVYVEDVYHQCIDLVLTGPLVGAGGTQGAAPSSDDDGGCSTSGRSVGTATWFVALGLAAGFARRRASRRLRDLKRR